MSAPTTSSTSPSSTSARDESGRGQRAFLVTAAAVHAGNYAFNLLLGRRLGPADFAELNLVVTFLLLLTLATHTVQLAAARATASLDVRQGPEAADALHGWLRRRARRWGVALAVLGVVAAPGLQRLFASPSATPYVVFALGLPALLLLGADRGRLQGTLAFGRLAATNAVEMVVRLVGGVVLVELGLGVPGAVAAITASFVLAALVARPTRGSDTATGRAAVHVDVTALRHATPLLLGPSFALLAGQVLVANGDVLVVKAAQPAVEAGRYAVLALLGRVVFYATATLVEVGFPLIARRSEAGRDAAGVLRLGLAVTAAMGAAATVGLALVGDRVIGLAFGPEYVAVAPLAWRYALATSLFSLAYVLATDGLARGRSRPAGLLVAGGLVQLFAVLANRHDLAAVVDVQVVAMAGLLLATAWARRGATAPGIAGSPAAAPAPA